MRTKLLTLSLMLIAATTAFARGGNELGNGGDIVYCPRSAEKAILLDVYESRFSNRKLMFENDGLSYEGKLLKIFDRWQRVSPLRMNRYREWLEKFTQEAAFIPNVELPNIPDEGLAAVPRGCEIRQIIVQLPEEDIGTSYKRYTVSKDLWDLLNENNKAALVLHELIYREAITAKHPNSMRVRYLNTILFSDSTIEEYFEASKDLNGLFLEWGWAGVEKFISPEDDFQKVKMENDQVFGLEDLYVKRISYSTSQMNAIISSLASNEEFAKVNPKLSNWKNSALAGLKKDGIGQRLNYIFYHSNNGIQGEIRLSANEKFTYISSNGLYKALKEESTFTADRDAIVSLEKSALGWRFSVEDPVTLEHRIESTLASDKETKMISLKCSAISEWTANSEDYFHVSSPTGQGSCDVFAKDPLAHTEAKLHVDGFRSAGIYSQRKFEWKLSVIDLETGRPILLSLGAHKLQCEKIDNGTYVGCTGLPSTISCGIPTFDSLSSIYYRESQETVHLQDPSQVMKKDGHYYLYLPAGQKKYKLLGFLGLGSEEKQIRQDTFYPVRWDENGSCHLGTGKRDRGDWDDLNQF